MQLFVKKFQDLMEDLKLTVEEVQQQVENAESVCRSSAKNIELMNDRYNRCQGELAQLQ